ncbi:MAG TPA: flagellar basal body P-ring protein FlgI [Phycisphaerae bacterium]|nr:flagellar basal body P-ring protein FlgI [Phycisphaerae bacterium]
MKLTKPAAWLVAALLGVFGALPACQDGWNWFDRGQRGGADGRSASGDDSGVLLSKAIEGTIGSVAYIRGQRRMAVKGYGVVAGLGQNGSTDCPPQIRKYLGDQISKRYRPGATVSGIGVSPEKLLSDPDTAVVTVFGEIPAAAQEGARFDVWVEALPRSETRSLACGSLYTCDLKLPGGGGSTDLVEGRTLAMAAGPVFVKPFASATDRQEGGEAHLRGGVVLGGGVVTSPRRLQLVLVAPSYQVARRVQDRINGRFGATEDVADATSPSLVDLSIPPEWVGREARLLALVMRLYLYSDPSVLEQRAQDLVEELLDAETDAESIALAWEGIGRSVLPVIHLLYSHPSPRASFHAASAGFRLGDEMAVEVLARHARDAASPHRLAAVRTLGEGQVISAVAVLETLLTDADQQVRLAAYRGLRRTSSAKIRSYQVGRDNFTLDVIACEGPALIWAKRTEAQRIALLGAPLSVIPPVFYVHPSEALTLSADEGAGALTLVRRTPYSGMVSGPIRVGLDVEHMVRLLGGEAGADDQGRVTGVGMDYAQVLEVVSRLCQDGVIAASFALEEPALVELTSPLRPEDRPESEF